MKKSSLVLMSVVLSGAAFAADLYSSEEHPGTCFELSLATPVQLPAANWTVMGLRANLIYGESFGVYGIDLGLTGYNRDTTMGVQAYGLGAWDENDVKGIQLSGLANVVCGNMTGLQLSGLVNFDRGEAVGLQLGTINYTGAFCGVQFGAINYDKSSSSGLQIGLVNADRSEFDGWSLGLVNHVERLSGFQLGAINIAAETGRGVQVGIFNSAAMYSGLQIGLLNLIGNGELPIMPIVNAQF